jgi:Tol biopolymer transport system component
MRIRHVLTGLVVSALVVVSAQAPVAEAAPSAETRTNLGGLIVFGADQTGSSQLYTVRPDGTQLRQITHLTNGDAASPDWSPDGRRIVFERNTAAAGEIAIMNADGTGLSMLPLAGPFLAQPSFTADGHGIVFERFDGVSDDALFTARLDGTHERRLTRAPAGYGDTEPNVSPDGRTVSFVRVGPRETDAALFTVDLRTGRQRQLTPFSFDVAIKTGWSRNGRRILFSRDAYGAKPGVSGNVVTISRTGHRLRALTHYTGGAVTAFAGSFSPDGSRVVYRREATDDYRLVVADSRGRHRTTILHSSTLRPRFIDWGPDVH